MPDGNTWYHTKEQLHHADCFTCSGRSQTAADTRKWRLEEPFLRSTLTLCKLPSFAMLLHTFRVSQSKVRIVINLHMEVLCAFIHWQPAAQRSRSSPEVKSKAGRLRNKIKRGADPQFAQTAMKLVELYSLRQLPSSTAK